MTGTMLQDCDELARALTVTMMRWHGCMAKQVPYVLIDQPVARGVGSNMQNTVLEERHASLQSSIADVVA